MRRNRRIAGLVALCVVAVWTLVWAAAEVQDYAAHYSRLVKAALATPPPNQPPSDDAYHNALAWSFAQALNTHPPDVLYFCDSVMGGHSDEEARTTMADMLGETLGKPVRSVSGAGYTAVVFTEYAALAVAAKTPPKLVILAVNPRSFCDGWFFSDAYSYTQLTRFLRLLTLAPGWKTWRTALVDRLNGQTLEQRIGPAQDWTGGQPLAEYFLSKSRPAVGFAPDRPDASRQDRDIRRHFLQNYMSVQIEPTHPMLTALVQTVDRLRAGGVQVLAYVTPVDVQEGERLAGPQFRAFLERDLGLIAGALRQRGIVCLNLGQSLPSDCFVDRDYACEHLSLRGRQLVVQALAQELERQGLAGGR